MSVTHQETPTKRQELTLFLVLTVVLAPVISVSLISGYGFFIWISQIIGGPPTY